MDSLMISVFSLLLLLGIVGSWIGVRAQFDARFRSKQKRLLLILGSMWVESSDDSKSVQDAVSKIAIVGILFSVIGAVGFIFSWSWLNALMRKMLIQ